MLFHSFPFSKRNNKVRLHYKSIIIKYGRCSIVNLLGTLLSFFSFSSSSNSYRLGDPCSTIPYLINATYSNNCTSSPCTNSKSIILISSLFLISFFMSFIFLHLVLRRNKCESNWSRRGNQTESLSLQLLPFCCSSLFE